MTIENSIQIAQAACTRVGLEPIASFEDESSEARVLTHNYDLVVQGELSVHDWRFASADVVAQRLVDLPTDGEYAALYQLPTGLLKLRKVFVNADVWRQWDRVGTRIAVDTAADDVVTVRGVYDLDESQWRAYFTELVTLCLAKLLCRGVMRNESMASAYQDEIIMQRRVARHADSNEQSPSRIVARTLIAIRYAGNGGTWST